MGKIFVNEFAMMPDKQICKLLLQITANAAKTLHVACDCLHHSN